MEGINVTETGFLALTSPHSDGNQTALVSASGAVWSYDEVISVFDSAEPLNFSGRTGVLVDDRLLSGLISCAIMRNATCVPLDPKMTRPEIEERIEQLGIKTVVIDNPGWEDLPDVSTVSVALKDKLVSWHGESVPGYGSHDALVLMTSGSTGRPKIVSLSHQNLVHSVHAIIASLTLTSKDRAVNLLPMSHIGGLVDLLLVPMVSGGSVVFGEAQSPGDIISLLAEQKPTWLQAAPAILQSLVHASKGEIDHHLRLIRSVSAPLSPSLFNEASKRFKLPLIEMYGMSETAGIIASNPLPPAEQKSGSVGKPFHCDVEVRNGGEIWVRSDGLFSGYQDRFDNEGLWDEGFFFTGDLGHFDDDGYLFLTGRSKELINRGGQKVAPSEIDRIVESWDEVREAASFGFPHSTLGEEVGLAFVLQDDAVLTDQEIRERLSSRLTDYKLPKRLLRLETLPRNQNGKLQRFALGSLPPPLKSQTEELSSTGKKILPLWLSALNLESVSNDLDFFDQGGDSLSATTLLVSVEKSFKISLAGFIFYENATINDLACAVEERLLGTKTANKRDVDFSQRVRKRLLRFLSSWPGKSPFPESYARIDDKAGADTPFLFWCCNSVKELNVITKNAGSYLTLVSFRSLRLVQNKKLRNYDLITRIYLDEIERLQPEGPLALGGFCEGGRIMVRVGRELIKKGREIKLLVLQDFNLEDPFPARIAMIHSSDWKRHPVKSHHDIHHGWQKIYRGRYGTMEKEGQHSRAFNEKSQKILSQFLKEQLEKSRTDKALPISRQDPQCTITLLTKLPRFLRVKHSYTMRVQVRNEGPSTIATNDGVVLHARWVDLNRDPKPGAPMFTPLHTDLKPGETTELEIDLICHKAKRLYQIQIAVLEEGWGWQPSVVKNSHRQWRIIL